MLIIHFFRIDPLQRNSQMELPNAEKVCDVQADFQSSNENYRIPYKTLVTFLADNNYLCKAHSEQVEILQSQILKTFQIEKSSYQVHVSNFL